MHLVWHDLYDSMFGEQRPDLHSFTILRLGFSSCWKKSLAARIPICFHAAGASAKRDYRKVEIIGNSIRIWRVKRGQFLLLGPFLLSPHKMKLLFLALLAVFAVSVNAEAHIPWPSATCDCDYFYKFPIGGCKVRKILQNISWEGKA